MSSAIIPYSLPLAEPLTTSYATLTEREGLLLSLTEGGLVGWGEAGPMPGWSPHPLAEVGDRVAMAVDRLDTDLLADVLDSLETVPEARAALAGAAADLGAQQAGLPLAAHLDGSAVERVRVHAALGAAAPERLVRDARFAVTSGFTALKLKVGAAPPADDVERVAAVRRAVGDEVELRLDANGAWDEATAVATLQAVADHHVAFCEEPVPGIAGLAAVGARSPVPVAVDESARTVSEIAAALDTGTISVVIVKPQAVGGPDLAVRALRMARDAGATAVVTSMIDSAIGVAHAVHVAAAAGSGVAHGVATSMLLATDVAGALPVEDGHVLVPTVPGLGVSPS